VNAPAVDVDLSEADARLLTQIREALPILSDLSRSDLLLYLPMEVRRAVVSDQARPHSIFPVYERDLVGKQVGEEDAPWVFQALSTGPLHRGVQSDGVRDVPVVRNVLPVEGEGGRAIAVLAIESNLLAYERHRRRKHAFRRALHRLQEQVLRGELAGAADLSPFGEHDGIVVVDLQRRVEYVSGIAANLYRRIGYMSSLVHRNVHELDTSDGRLVDEALSRGRSIERETVEHGRIWIRKALPLYVRNVWWRFWQREVPAIPSPAGSVPVGALWTVCDATDARDKEQELKAKLAMIQEVHHRVKNNLQVIASLLRLQARRTAGSEVRQPLLDSVNRILSVAVVHEFLSYDSAGVINLREVTQRIVEQMGQSVMDPGKGIDFQVTGPSIYLSAQKATACALVINELLLNAVEHGYQDREIGLVTIHLADDGEWVTIDVGDDGAGLPPGFDLEEHGGLGLRIVGTLVQGDLKGKFEMHGERGARAVASFPKTSLGGART